MKVSTLLFAFLPLIAAATTAQAAYVVSSKDELTAMMLADFLQFYKHERTCLLASKGEWYI